MLDRIENTRRLREQCDRRARLLYRKGDLEGAVQMQRQVDALGWQLVNMQAEAALATFAARVED